MQARVVTQDAFGVLQLSPPTQEFLLQRKIAKTAGHSNIEPSVVEHIRNRITGSFVGWSRQAMHKD